LIPSWQEITDSFVQKAKTTHGSGWIRSDPFYNRTLV